LLPFMFQLSLGGLIESGGMMLWSFLALVGAMSVQDVRQSVLWLFVYLIFVIAMLFVDKHFNYLSIGLNRQVTITFFVVNIAFISTVIFSLMLYFIKSRNDANTELEKLAKSLEIKVEQRTADLVDANTLLNSTNDELQAIINQVQEQNSTIELKNKSITDSLNYARRIQKAILDNSRNNCNKLNEYFIYFKPRDIVSGDFYWMHCVPEKDLFIAIIADCTGHGVPGAFMSLIGDSLLNQIILDKEIYDPGQVLTLMDQGVNKAMKYEDNNRRDGMDMAVLVLKNDGTEFKYAGAKIPLLCVHNGEQNILKCSVHPIGGGLSKIDKIYETSSFTPKPNSALYMFTDGFADQFGHTHNRKYLTRNFRDFITQNAHFPCNNQMEIIKAEHKRWKGDNPQTDDILVLGIKV